MTETHAEAQPLQGTNILNCNNKNRYLGMDAVRGFAVCGILMRNIFAFAIPPYAYSFPTIWNSGEYRDILSWAFVEVFVDGVMRALFALLFGAAAMLVFSSIDKVNVEKIDLYFRRSMWLMAFGLVHSFLLLCSFDILFIYGLLGLFLFPFRNMSPKALLGIAVAGMVVSATMLNLQNGDLFTASPTQNESVESALNEAENATEQSPGDIGANSGAETDGQAAPTAPQAAQPDANQPEPSQPESNTETNEELLTGYLGTIWAGEVDEMQQGYGVIMRNLSQTSLANYSSELLTNHFTDIGILFFIGMAFFKLGIITGQKSLSFYLSLCLGGYAVGLLVNGFETFSDLLQVTLSLEAPLWTNFSYDVGRIAMAMGHLGLIMTLSKVRLFNLVTRLFAAAGRMALTNYMMQTIICTSLFFGYGLGLYGQMGHFDLLMMAFGIAFAQLIFSAIYLRYFRLGPAEWLWRRLSKGKAKPAKDAVSKRKADDNPIAVQTA